MNKSKKEFNRKHKRWCSKHQNVHLPETEYWSCRFPNDKELNDKKKEWRKSPLSYDGMI